MSDQHPATQGLTRRILIAMGAGAVVGLLLNALPTQGFPAEVYQFLVTGLFDLGGAIFIASLKMLVVPLVFVSLVCGVFAIGGHSRLGMISVKTVGFYLLTTALAITLALVVANVIDPGVGLAEIDAGTDYSLSTSPSIWQTLKDIVPTNVIAAMAEGNMLQIIVFAILFGIAMSKVREQVPQIEGLFVQLDKIIMEMVLLLMLLAPYGVFCLLAKMFADSGFGNILVLAKYFFTVLLVLVLHVALNYSTLLWLLTRLSPRVFFSKMRRVWLFGFSTASSNATLPITLETVEERLGVRNEVASFTVPLGATINMDGTAIMQGVATVFIAQYYGVDIGFSGYLMVILTATLASIGTAGVPGVGLIMLTMVLTQVGLPAQGIALIIGVDRLLDMVRTAVNITGDAVASVVVAKSEGLLDEDRYRRDE